MMTSQRSPPSVFLERAFEVCEELIGRLGEHAEEEGCGEGDDEDAQAIDEELHQALTAFAGEASAQVVLVAGEGIGDGGAALLETDRPRRQPGLLRGQLQLPPIDVLLAPLPPEELDALEAPLPS